ncbi:hypothetical protein SAMN05216553_11853 [Lentzea fradiae]|uniref:DUF4142 domain-containing protein n=1 Tax=Lentzea fradiae TaxID=200378 RepID=A0A1G8AR09_9PSEU|nr:hypothetical protein [Lentzea fradiae]SDH23304.1 hypothetical protein SAMN05216553_11853 [Lentzea fradiae]
MRTTAGLVLACVLSVSACSGQAAAPAPATSTTSSTVTTTPEAPGADPVAWFDAYCGPLGVAALALREIDGKASQGMAAVKEAVVSWVALAASSDRMTADSLEKLGPLGSDVSNAHERLVKAKRQSADGFDDAAGRLRALAADDVFPERYEQVMATSGGGARENAELMFRQIAETPKYAEAFRSNKTCESWQGLAKQAAGQ